MEPTYDPKAVEEKWLAAWEKRRLFHSDSSRGGEPYCIVIPPPNVTGILHMGHALNNTIQDVLVRWRRMQGRNVVWMPGTDHAGIATQNVVERALRKEGLTREQLGREEFVKRVWEWKAKYGSTIIRQLKRLGCSCDWDRERFTMDEGLSRAVVEVFVRLYEKGLIYRANYIINWCPRCHTALSDEESEHREITGRLYHIRYPLDAPGSKETIVVATTRPETLLGDTAVAVNPGDGRYRRLAGRKVYLPLLNRELRVIFDEYVDPKFGTGIVKVTPAHDPNDFLMGQRHGLPSVNVMNGDGTMNDEAGPYRGLDRFECRKRIVADLEKAGLIVRIEDHRHAVGHCYRCDTIIEPRLSPQWFVRMKPLAAPAIEAVRDGRIVFIPARWTKVYLEWMENIRDWCISRQIWWGHRIPVFSCGGCGKVWAARGVPEACPSCGGRSVKQDDDVLDTWFSSWLWPFSTFGWPEENTDLRFYYPTHDMVTASEIIFFWVARMIMAGCEFMGDIPFRNVYIHGTVRDDQGRKMSKSLGNSIDPLDIINQFSADALRFSLMMAASTGQDVYLSNEKFEIGRNFCTKLWNACRFLLLRTADGARLRPFASRAPELDASLLGGEDTHILAKLHETVRAVSDGLAAFRFNDASHALYEFVWHQYCDWYLEATKDVLDGPDCPRREQTLRILHHAMACSLKLLHPFIPFLTEELWRQMGYGDEEDFISLARWPEPFPESLLAKWGATPDTVEYVTRKHDIVRAGRALRSDYEIPPSRKVSYLIKPRTMEDERRLLADVDSLRLLLRADKLEISSALQTPRGAAGAVASLGDIFMPLAGLIDPEVERKRLQGRLARLEGELERVSAKLRNAGFVSKAPADVVEGQRRREQELRAEMEKVRGLLAAVDASQG